MSTYNQCNHRIIDYHAHWKSVFTYNKGTDRINGYQSHWKSVTTYDKGNHSINGYQSHSKSVSTYIKGNHRSTDIILTGFCVHIYQRQPQHQPLTLTGNQCPPITRATTASVALSLAGNKVHIYQGQPQFNGKLSHWKSVSRYKKGSHSINYY